jgi:hypothetical protein
MDNLANRPTGVRTDASIRQNAESVPKNSSLGLKIDVHRRWLAIGRSGWPKIPAASRDFHSPLSQVRFSRQAVRLLFWEGPANQ